jgi:hypothetical protein
MVPSESAPQELSNEWSCQYVSTTLIFLGNFCVPPVVTIQDYWGIVSLRKLQTFTPARIHGRDSVSRIIQQSYSNLVGMMTSPTQCAM